MKKLTAFLFTLICAFTLAGCQKTVKGSELYAFPEPTPQVTVSFYSQGQVTILEIGSEAYDPNDLAVPSLIQWFYDLELTPCDTPEAVEGSESYGFSVKGEHVFSYENRGLEAYVIIEKSYYKVNDPSSPPIG